MEPLKCMFDTVIFNRIVEHNVSVELFEGCIDVFATHIQQDEIDKSQEKSPDKHTRLCRAFNELHADGAGVVSTESAVWNVSKWNRARWTKDNNLYQPIKEALDRRKRKENNIQDALIAETAIEHHLTLVTDDGNLRDVAAKYGADCMSWEQLLEHCSR